MNTESPISAEMFDVGQTTPCPPQGFPAATFFIWLPLMTIAVAVMLSPILLLWFYPIQTIVGCITLIACLTGITRLRQHSRRKRQLRVSV